MSSEVLVLLGSIGRSQALVDDETWFLEALLEWSLEGLGALGRLGLEGILLFVYPNLLFSGSIYRLEGSGEVLRRVLQLPLR